MADSLSRLIVTLEAQTASYQKGLENANRQLSAFKRTQQQTLSAIEGAFSKIGTTIAAVFSVRAVEGIAQFVKNQVELADALGETADAAGLGAEQYQRLIFAFTQLSSATKQSAEKGLQTFNLNLGKARDGSAALQKSAHELGIDLTQNTNVAIEQAFTGLAKIADTGRRAALAGDFFGDKFGPKVAGALNGTADALRRVAEGATGIVSDENIIKASKLNDEFQRLDGIVNAEMANAVLDNADAFETLAKSLGHVESKAIGALAELTRIAKNPKGEFQFFKDTFLAPDNFNAPPLGLDASNAAAVEELKKKAAAAAAPPTPGSGPNKVTIAGAEQMKKEAAALAEELKKQYEAADKAQLESRIETLNDAGDYAKKQAEEDARDIDQWHEWEYKREDERTKKLNEQAESFGELFAANLVEASDNGFKSVLASWTRTLEQMVLIAAGKKLFTAVFGGAQQGSWLSELGSIFGGGKAAGGPVMAGTPYMVGERGPELFIPQSSGNIVPNGSHGATIIQHIDARGAQDPAQVFFAVKTAKSQALGQIRDDKRRGRAR